MNNLIIPFLAASLFSINSCGILPDRKSTLECYKLSEPDKIYKLDSKLNEISGLHYYEGSFYSIADEKGMLYQLNEDFEIIDKFEFDDKGDYEGICTKGSTFYTIQSDGDIFELKGLKGDKVDDVEKYETDLDEDCEGFIYDVANEEFLIACKDKAGDIDRAIYSLKDLDDKPKIKYKFSFDEIKEELLNNDFDETAFDIKEAFSFKDGAGIFGPSGIAIHPITKDFYVLSGTSSLLIVLNNKGELKHVETLPRDDLKQPEGITFSPDGTLYISSEKANMQHAKILKYTYRD